MYHDNGSYTSRLRWKFTYKGKELIDAANNQLAEFVEKETEARQKLSKLMADMSVTVQDDRVLQLKTDIEIYGRQTEECRVFAHEFKRNYERDFHLSLGDVVFFGLEQ